MVLRFQVGVLHASVLCWTASGACLHLGCGRPWTTAFFRWICPFRREHLSSVEAIRQHLWGELDSIIVAVEHLAVVRESLSPSLVGSRLIEV